METFKKRLLAMLALKMQRSTYILIGKLHQNKHYYAVYIFMLVTFSWCDAQPCESIYMYSVYTLCEVV